MMVVYDIKGLQMKTFIEKIIQTVVFSLALIVLNACGGSGDKDKNEDGARLDLDKSAYRVSAYKYDTNGDGIYEDIQRIVYNDFGKQRFHNYDTHMDGIINSITEFYYSEKEYLSSIEYDYGADGTINQRIIYTHDTHGYVLSSEQKNFDNGFTSLSHFVNDEEGKVLVQSNYIDGSLSSVTRYTYDSKGNAIEKRVESSVEGRRIVRIYLSTFDTMGNVLKTVYLNPEDTENPDEEHPFNDYIYDSHGYEISSTIYSPDTDEAFPPLLRQNTYYSNGLIKTTLFMDAEKIPYKSWEYLYEEIKK